MPWQVVGNVFLLEIWWYHFFQCCRFAAEIFHDLHEEVMATAARGHGLMLRVQQLEEEFPSMEKSFLAHTSLLQNASMAGRSAQTLWVDSYHI